MKKVCKFILLLLILIIINGKKVSASNYNDAFYPGHFITGEYIRKEVNGKIENKQSRFIFRKSDNMFAYCIEPFKTMKENEIYNSYVDDYYVRTNMTQDVWNKIRLISYYGYGYSNHTEDKWYTITQIMIWRVVEPTAKFNWTDGLGGKVINKYEKEIAEINNLVSSYNKLPNYANKTFKMSINDRIIIEDKGYNLHNTDITFDNKHLDLIIEDNSIIVNSSKVGHYNIEFSNTDKRFKRVPIIYIDDIFQNIIVIGNNDTIKFKLSIIVEAGNLIINKLDKDTNSISSNSNASIIGTVYNLFNSDGKLIKELIIESNGQAIFNNLPYGNYCVREVKSGQGYIIDDKPYCFVVDSNNLNIELNLNNKVIEKEVIIDKFIEIESTNSLQKEKNIKFEITGLTHNYSKIVSTDNNGRIKIVLPFGRYLFKQLNTTDGYSMVDNFEVDINDNANSNYYYKLVDKKNSYNVVIPNTGLKQINIAGIILAILSIVYGGLSLIEHKKN